MSEFISNKLQQNAVDNEEKKAQERKKNLLYLIFHYLKDNGCYNSADTLCNEAQLQGNIEVCDNIDLDIILQEYSNYYHLKFKKNPKFCKKILSDETSVNNSKLKRVSSGKLPVTNNKSASKVSDVNKTSPESNSSPFIIKPLLQTTVLEEKCLSSTLSNGDRHEIKPLFNFEGFNTEWKELAEFISQNIILKNLKVNWTDIKGLENAKKLLKEAVIYPLEYPKIFSKIPIPWRGILLYGPPGTGKTMLAKALASQCSYNTFFNMSSSSLISKWRGESEKLVRVLFELAKYQAPSTIFIDEIDALSSKREEVQHDASRRFKSELLIQMDGLVSHNERIFFLATSNLPWDIDPAMLRRFEKRILIDYPDASARESMFKHYLREMSNAEQITQANFVQFANLTVGYTGSDIKMICKESALEPIRKIIDSLGEKPSLGDGNYEAPIWAEQVLNAIKNTMPTAKKMADKYYRWHKEYGCI